MATMNQSSAFVVVCAVALVTGALYGTTSAQPVTIQWRQSIQICGSHLTDFMLRICQIHYYKPGATAHVPPVNRRQKRKIIDECCKMPCTYGYIYDNYCEHQSEGDTETEFVVPDKWPKPLLNFVATRRSFTSETPSNSTTADVTTASSTASAITASTAPSTISSTITAGPTTNFVTSTSATSAANVSSWFERFLRGLKFW